ncbi:MAG: nickel pincer cofactor biosynthesis protein LarC [Acidobacteria bacterium]|nr:nickel pincer cofactor biosynthesis protein LarC [Acidobacteriota bacterium]
MGRVMYLDCFSGAAGDMLLGAFLDAGLPLEALQRALGSLAVDHELRVTRVIRAGISATSVQVLDPHRPAASSAPPTDAGAAPHAHGHHGEADHHADREHHSHHHDHDHHHHHDHDHQHDHGHHHHGHDHGGGRGHSHPHAHGADGHRTLHEIAHLIDHSSLSAAGKARAKALFHRLGEAEAAIHDMPLDEVHLHEVGALDSIIDIVGNVFAFEWFGIDDVVASPVNVGGGTVEIAHGRYPVPAPATARLITGAPVYSAGPQVELLTPTGALLVSGYAKSYGALPPMRIEHVGYGAGTRDFRDVPNVVRVVIGERAAATGAGSAESIVKIECEIDDMSPQLFAPAMERLSAQGALDVFLTPVQMKKNRPGTLVTVLGPEDRRQAIADVLFRETTTLGVRFERMERETLERHWEDVSVLGGVVRMKIGTRGGEVLNAAPEFDDCVRIAEATGRPVKHVQADAMQAWHTAAAGRRDR